VHSPYFARASLLNIESDLAFLDEHGLLPEVYLPADRLESLAGEDLDHLIKWRERGLDVSFHAPFMDLSPAGLDPRVLEVTRLRFNQVRDLAEIVRPRHIVFHPGYDKWRYGRKPGVWLERSLATWSGVLDWGARIGTRIVLENVFDVDPGPMLQLRVHFEGSLGLCFDSGHFLLFSAIPLQEWLTALGDSLWELHLHDNHGDEDTHLPVGEGIFDFSALFTDLSKRGTEPLTVLENHSRDETVRSLERMKGYSG